MNKKLLPFAIAMAFATGAAQATSFVNGTFETGDFTGWTQGGGSWTGSPLPPVNPALYAGGPSNNYIVGPGTDALTGLSTVYGGSYSAKVNDQVNNYSVSTLQQSVLNYTDTNIYFAWNAVLQGSHGLTDSDYFSLTLRDDTSGTDIVSRSYSSAGSIGTGTSGVTWTDYLGNGWISSGWVVENIDLAALGVVGDDFTLTLLASDCPYGGHAGYAYLDGFGSVIPTPEPGTLALLGMGLAGFAASRRRKAI